MIPCKKKTPCKRIALVLSLCALILWGLLGTGASLAWFTDTSPKINNIFHFGTFDVAVSHRLRDGQWEAVDSQTKIFDENALYEPGYVQTVYLKVENRGTVPFEFHTAVNVNGCTIATNVFGQQFLLQDYLKFGILAADAEEAMANSIPDRKAAAGLADMPLHNYDTETAVLVPGATKYIAIIVCMPEEVGNSANYRGDTAANVELGITVKADQIRSE